METETRHLLHNKKIYIFISSMNESIKGSLTKFACYPHQTDKESKPTQICHGSHAMSSPDVSRIKRNLFNTRFFVKLNE